MKTLRNSALLVLALGLVLTYSGCGPDPVKPTPQQEKLALLAGTWTVASASTNVTLDGVSKTTDYANFELTLAGTDPTLTMTYTTAGRPALSPWPASGTWTFSEASPTTVIVRDPTNSAESVEMTYTVSDTNIELTFEFTKAGYQSRTKDVTGIWVFTMKAK